MTKTNNIYSLLYNNEDNFLKIKNMSNPKFQRILITIEESDLSQKVIEYAKALNLNKETSITLLTIVPPVPPDQLGFDPVLGQTSVVVPELVDVEQAIAENFIAKFSKSFPEVGHVSIITKIGTIKQEILSYASEWNADLIIMGTHGRTGFDHFISGSVSESVTRKSTCPVLIVPTKVEQ